MVHDQVQVTLQRFLKTSKNKKGGLIYFFFIRECLLMLAEKNKL